MRTALRTLVFLSLASGIATGWAAPSDVQIGGESAFDVVRADGLAPSYPLRYPNVTPNSERVDLDGRPLKRDEDYQMDYDRGLIVIFRPVRVGSSLRVTYRHDPTKKSTGSTAGSGIGSLTGAAFNFAGGSQQLVMGMGMAERKADGSLSRSNLYGLKTKFSLTGGGALSGVMFLGDNQAMRMRSVLDDRSASGDDGKSQAFLQNLSTRFLGGKFSAGGQDISTRFSGWQAFRDSGYSDKEIQSFQKERGLKRFNMSWSDIGPLGFRGGYDKVADKKELIETRSLGFSTGGFTGDWSSQRVGDGFSRFKDLSNADRDQLGREKGMDRASLALGYKSRGTHIAWNSIRVEDGANGDFVRRSGEFKAGGWSVGFSDQRVEDSFKRFDGTRQRDAGQLAQERGLRRQDWTGSGSVGGVRLAFSENRLRKDLKDSEGSRAQAATLAGKGWSYDYSRLDLDRGMDRVGSMSNEEGVGVLDAIGRMYSPVAFGKRPEERGILNGGAGIDRVGQRFRLGGFAFEDLQLVGQTDQANQVLGAWKSGSYGLSYRRQVVGSDFNELNRLQLFERDAWGSVAGIDRTDWAGDWSMGRRGSLKLAATDAEREDRGGLKRRQFSFNSRDLDLSWNSRSLDSRWQDVNGLQDPERDLLSQMVGFSQSDWSFRLTPRTGTVANMMSTQAKNDETGEHRMVRQWSLDTMATRSSRLQVFSFNRNDERPDEVLARQDQFRVRVDQAVGKYGILCLEREDIRYDGSQLDQPDSRSTTVGYSHTLNAKTSIGAERTDVTFENGDRESATTGRVTTLLTKNAGIQLSETMVDRKGKGRANEHRRDFGFWWDLGGGMRLNYNFNRNSNTLTQSTQQAGLELTPGEIAGLAVGAATYRESSIDRGNSNAAGNFQLSTAKPLQWGAMRDLTLKFGADTFRDQGQYRRENRSMGAGFRVGKLAFGWDYNSQVGLNGDLAVDRSFRFQTDQAEKAPLRASVFYKIRTLPGDQQWMIRDYKFTWRMMRGAELSHQLSTNPEIARGDVILGSLPQMTRSRKWRLDFDHKGSTQAGLSFEEVANDQAKTMSRIGGINLKLFAKNPSPLMLFYGVEQNDRDNKRRTMHRYSLRYDQRPGPNQLLSLFLGNVSWQHSRDSRDRLQNWSMRLEYQLRF